MHSSGTMSRPWQRSARPVTACGTSLAEITWFGTMSASCSNQNVLIAVSTRPLSGMPGRREWS